MRVPKPVLAMLAAGVLLAIALIAVGASQEVSAEPGKSKAAITKDKQLWEISKAKVVSPGEAVELPEGTLYTDYVIEAKVKAAKGKAMPKGDFLISVQAFSPNEDMPGQKKGLWYVKGDWQITKDGATEADLEPKHSAARLGGTLLAELPFNPATESGPLAAKVRIPMSPDGGGWSQGDLTFSGNEKFEGAMIGDMEFWPESQGGSQ